MEMVIGYFIFVVMLIIFVMFYLHFDEFKNNFLKTFFSDKKEEIYVKICPKCGSTKIIVDFSNPVVWDSGAPVKNKCKSCGYISNIFPEVTNDKIELYKNELKNNISKGIIKFKNTEKIDAKTGFYFGKIELYFIFITIMLTLFISLMASLREEKQLPLISILVIGFSLFGFIYFLRKKSIN